MSDPLAARVPEPLVPLFEHAQEIIARHFSDRTDEPSKGTIEIGGERHILVSASSMSVDFYELIRNLFPDQDAGESEAFARNLLFDIAHALGVADARKFHRKLDLEDPVEKLSVGPIFFAYSGWAFVDIHPESKPSPDQDYFLVYDHPYSFESDAWMRAGKTSEFPVCTMNSGYSSGWCEESFGMNLVATEIMCKARGDDCCRFIMAPPEQIDRRIQEYLHEYPEARRKARHYEIPEFFSRKKAEEKLARKEAQYRSVFETTPAPLLLVDGEGNVVDANPAARDLFGFREPAPNLNRILADPGLTARMAELLAREGSFVEQVTMVREDSEPLELEIRCIAFPFGETPGNLVLVDNRTEAIRSERERIRMAEQMRHTQKLESLGILTGGIAHDFNNLLLTIMGNAHLALGKATGDEGLTRNLEKILTASKAASDLTNQMLVYSGKAQVALEPVDLTGLVREMGGLLGTAISHRVRLQDECAADLPSISGDPSQLRQVVMNFIINASDAIGEDHGTVTIRTSLVDADRSTLDGYLVAESFSPGTCVCLEVEDSGCGMDGETLGKIFDPFFTTKFVGRGLGLASVHGIIRSHGGCIRVTSAPGHGTCFTVLFPLAAESVRSVTDDGAACEVDRGSFNILVVDDDAESREIMADMLRGLGWSVEAVNGGRECLSRLEGGSPVDAVLLDLSMPDMGGDEVIVVLKGRHPDLPVLVCTGFSELVDAPSVVSLGEERLLKKPFGPQELDRAVTLLFT